MGHDKEFRHDAEIRQLKEDVRVLAARVNVLTASPRDAEKALDNGGWAKPVEPGGSADAERTEEVKRQLTSKATWHVMWSPSSGVDIKLWSCCNSPASGPHADHCSNRDVEVPGHADRSAEEKAPAVEERQGGTVGRAEVVEAVVKSETYKEALRIINRWFDENRRLRACLRDIGSLADRVSAFMPSGVDRGFARGIVNKVNRALRYDGSIGLDANPETTAAPVDHAVALGELRLLFDNGIPRLFDARGRRRFSFDVAEWSVQLQSVRMGSIASPVPLAPENADASDEEAEERDEDKVPHGPV